MTAKELKEALANVPDDAEVYKYVTEKYSYRRKKSELRRRHRHF